MSAITPTLPIGNPYEQLVRLMVSALVENWKSLLPRFKRLLKQLGGQGSNAQYEILDYDVTLDLPDPTGKLAVFRRRQKVRFLQDHVIAYQDEAWGDGEVVAGYKCSPGVPVDMFRQGPRCLVLISLRQTKNRGDVMEFNIERMVKDGFTGKDEWLEVETRYPTKHLRVQVVFPADRQCIEATVAERKRDRAIVLGEKYRSVDKDGRQVLTWENKRPVQGESYTICWSW